jgi:hypothetical protein
MERRNHAWGYELILWKDKSFTVKLIHIDNNCETEVHKHMYKKELIVDEGLNTIFVDTQQLHALVCEKGRNFTEFIEVSKNDSDFDNIKVNIYENNKGNS